MRFGDLTFHEIHAEIEAGALAIVPMGCTEQQGPHLPVDFESWFRRDPRGRRLSPRHGAPRDSFACPAGTAVRPDAGARPFRRRLRGPPCSTARCRNDRNPRLAVRPGVQQGHGVERMRWSRLVPRRGSGRRVERSSVASVHAVRVDVAGGRWGDVPGGHADSFTMSITMYLRPETLPSDRIREPSRFPTGMHRPSTSPCTPKQGRSETLGTRPWISGGDCGSGASSGSATTCLISADRQTSSGTPSDQ